MKTLPLREFCDAVLRMLVELIGYTVARAALPFLSFGKIYVAPFSASALSSLRPCFRRDADGRMELRQDTAGWIGFAICVVALLVVVLSVGICLGPHADLTLRKYMNN